jgi:hypothetical protein
MKQYKETPLNTGMSKIGTELLYDYPKTGIDRIDQTPEQIIHEERQITKPEQLRPGRYIKKHLREDKSIEESPIEILSVDIASGTFKVKTPKQFTYPADTRYMSDTGIRKYANGFWNPINWLVPASD